MAGHAVEQRRVQRVDVDIGQRVAVDDDKARRIEKAVDDGNDLEAIDRAAIDGTSLIDVPGAHARPPVLVPRSEPHVLRVGVQRPTEVSSVRVVDGFMA